MGSRKFRSDESDCSADDTRDRELRALLWFHSRTCSDHLHQLNQPLQVIMTWCDVVREKAMRGHVDPESACNAMSEALNAVEQLNDVMAAFRRHTVHREPEFQDVSLDTIIASAVAAARHRVPRAAAGCRIQVAEPVSIPVNIRADPQLLISALTHLIVNGMEAAVSGGQPDPCVEVELRSGDDPGSLQILVSDNGSGWDGDVLNSSFCEFQSTRDDHVGYGLFLCRSILHSHGGRLSLDHSSPSGCRFSVTLPVAG